MEPSRRPDHHALARTGATPVDLEIARLAARQHGIVAHSQLNTLGLDRRAIWRRCEAGSLHRIFRLAYAVGHAAISERGRWMAAVLAAGPGALLSHASAGRLRGLRIADDGPHVSAPRRNLRRIRGVVLHRPRALTDDDRDEIDGIPVTSIARTLLDIAPSVSEARLTSFIDSIERRDRPDWSPARSLCLRMTGHHGIARLASALKAAGLFPEFTRSDLERELLRLCDDAGVRRPAMNYAIGGFEVDAHWPDTNVVIELDSHEYHSTPLAFETDRARDVKLQMMGLRVFRLTPSSFGTNRAATIELAKSLAPTR